MGCRWKSTYDGFVNWFTCLLLRGWFPIFIEVIPSSLAPNTKPNPNSKTNPKPNPNLIENQALLSRTKPTSNRNQTEQKYNGFHILIRYDSIWRCHHGISNTNNDNNIGTLPLLVFNYPPPHIINDFSLSDGQTFYDLLFCLNYSSIMIFINQTI